MLTVHATSKKSLEGRPTAIMKTRIIVSDLEKLVFRRKLFHKFRPKAELAMDTKHFLA